LSGRYLLKVCDANGQSFAYFYSGERAIESLIEDRPADFFLAFTEATRIDREGQTLQ